jgi:hypothetical protein
MAWVWSVVRQGQASSKRGALRSNFQQRQCHWAWWCQSAVSDTCSELSEPRVVERTPVFSFQSLSRTTDFAARLPSSGNVFLLAGSSDIPIPPHKTQGAGRGAC